MGTKEELAALRKKYGTGTDALRDGSSAKEQVAALRTKYGTGLDGGGSFRLPAQWTRQEQTTPTFIPMSQGMGMASFGNQMMGQTPSAVIGGSVNRNFMSAGERKMTEQPFEKRKAAAEQRMKELDEIEADLKDFEIAVQNIPAHQRPVKNIGGFTSSEAAREEYNRVMAEYAAMLKENGQTDSNFGRNVRYVLERGGAGTMAALEGLADAGAAALADERVGKALRNVAPALGMAQQMNKLFDQLGVLPEGAGFDELADKMLSASPSQERMQSIEGRYAPGKVGQTAGEVSQAVGGMVPTIAANILLPGSGLAVTGVQAGGQNAQQAYQEGASVEQAVNFGTLTGVLEAGVEAMFGGIAGLGKGFLDTAAGKGIGKMVSKLGASKTGKVLAALANNVFVKGLADSLGEGIEEGVSAILTPYLARLTYNKSAETATVNEVLHDVFVGALTGGVFQGVNAVTQAALGNKKAASGMETVEQDGKPSSVGAEGAATFHQGKAMEESAKPAEAGAQPAQVGGERVQAGMDTPEQGTKQKAVEWAKPKAAGVYDTRTKSDAEPLNRVLSDRNVLYLKAVSRATGLRINIVDASENADGWYENGEIFIAENCKDPVNWIATHEVTHHLERAAPEAYARYLEKVKNYLSEKEVLQKDIDKVRSVYAEREVALTEDSALREVAANFTERLMLDENLFNRVAREDRSLAQRILDSLKEFIRRIRTTWSGQEIRQLEATRKAWEKALRESRGKTVETAERQYLFAGERAKTADSAEGWFRGADGKRRFEVDDSRMKVKEVTANFGPLEDLIDHPKLFEAYPEMKEVYVWFRNLQEGVNGQYIARDDAIVVPFRLKNNPEELRAVLIHEIQHAIQHKEGFSTGSNVRAWERRIEEGFDTRRAADKRKAQKIEEELSAIQKESPEFYRDMTELNDMQPDVPRGKIDWDTLEKIEEDPVEWQQYDAKRKELEAKYGDTEVWDFNDLMYRRKKAAANAGRTALELYRDTAGEIEARDAASRRDLTTEERRNRKPNTGNEDTVFADGTVSYNEDVVPFRKQVDDVLDGKASEETSHLNMGKTPELYAKFGFDTDIPVLITAKHVKNMNAKVKIGDENPHGLSRGKIAGLQRKLAEPVMVMVSNSNPDCVVVVTDTIDTEKRPVIMAVKPDGTGNYMRAEVDANIVLSGYGRNGFDRFLISAFSDGRMLYCDYEKSRQLQQTPGVQFPNNLPRGDFTDNVAQFSARVKKNRETKKGNRQNSLRGLSDAIAEAEQGDKLAQGNALRREKTRLSDVEHQKKLLEDGGMSALKENEKKIKALERRLQKLEGTMQPKTLDRKGQASTGARYLPTTAKRDLRRNLLDMFSVQDGVRAVAGKYIDWVADRMLNSGSLLDKDRTDLFNYLYNTGMVENTATDAELDTMEREVEWALRTFAEKARLEISLRKRAGTALKEERAARRKSLERQREFKNLQELQQKTLKQLQWLSKNRQRASQDLKAAFDEVLGNIDTFAVGAANDMNWSKKHQATWRDLAQMYKAAKENDPNFLPSKELDRIVTRLDGDKIADMDVDALMELYRAAVGIRAEFYNRNNVINDEMNRMLAEIYTDSVREISSAAGRFTGKWADKLVNLQQLTPMNVLERMAGWNRDGAFYSMARQLERGERDMRDYTVKANAMLEEFLTEHADWVKRADGQGKDAIWYEIEVPELLELGMGDKPIFGETRKVYMTPSQKVHMYLESKNYANLLHMVGGRTFANRELYSKGKRGEAFAQGTTIRLAPETVKKLVSDLTEEEMELARLLERYYDEFASGRINRTSNALHGFDKAVTRNYAPIFTNKNYVQGEIGVFDMTAEGVGVMRGRQQYAKNPSYQIGCFDAFERHVDQTARYVGMAIPARNWNALLNWREKNNSTWDVITHKWGKESKEYIEDLLKRLQGGKGEKGDIVSAGAGKLMSNYISSIFGVNPSIVFKQIGSFFMAMPELGIENIPKPAQLKVDKKLIGKYTSELAWRGMGYATPETKQLKENPTKLQTNKVIRFLTGGAITAMDQATASALWPWAENKVRKEFPELEVGTPEQIDAGESPFYKKVAAEFNDAVNRSQSVSDEIHQSSLKKSKNPVTKTLTMFKSDSAQGYNQLRQRIGEARYYEKSGADEETVRKARLAAGEAVLGILANNAWAAVVSFLIALWKNKGKKYRDDEEELTARSVMLEMAGNIFDGMAGLVIGGEELAEALGSIVTGDRWYGFDAPGIAQVEDLVELVINSGQGAIEFAKGAANVLGNDGDFGKYLKDHSNEIVGGIKELAQAAAQYFGGLPVGNLEAYLLGGVKWALPGVATAYEDALQRVEKNTLSGLSGKALEQRMGTLMKRRIGEVEKNTVKAMSALYESGHKGAAPTSAPDSVTVKGVEKTLNEAEKQFFDKAWSAAVVGVIDEIAASEEFLTADKKTQEDMLEKLYGYAREKAKAAILEEYELAKWVQEADGDVKAGESLSKWIVWEVLSSDVSSDFDKLTGAGLPNQRALEIAEELDELEPEAGKEDVSAMQRYGAIFSLPLSASDLDKAVKAVMSDSAYSKYKTARDAGVSADTYWWFLKRTSGISGDGKKEKILSFINSLKLSDKQKDTLFLAAGYKESGLPDAPWN